MTTQFRLFGMKLDLVRVLIYTILTVGALISIFPFVWMVLTSFKSYGEVATGIFFPSKLRWINYVNAWNSQPFGRYFLNTIFVAVTTTTLLLITSSLAAYAFAMIDFWGRDTVFLLFLATMMIPGEVTLIPNFLMIKKLGWYNTYTAQIVPFIASPFYIFLLRQFFKTIPRELHDAAILDGCSHLCFLSRIVAPLSKAAIVTVAMLGFIGSWDAFLWPLIVTSKPEVRPIQVGLRSFLVEAGTQTQELMAAATFTIAPIIILYFLTQKQFTEGIMTSGLKG
jgi:multiple sugar transport system permease protein